MHCPEGLGDCPLGTGSVLVPFRRKASSVFLSVFSGFNTNKVTEGEANSTFPNSAKNVVKLPRMSEIPHPTYVSVLKAKYWQKLPQVPASIWETVQSSAPCSRSCLSVSAQGPRSSCFSQYLLYKILQPSCPSDLLPN